MKNYNDLSEEMQQNHNSTVFQCIILMHRIRMRLLKMSSHCICSVKHKFLLRVSCELQKSLQKSVNYFLMVFTIFNVTELIFKDCIELIFCLVELLCFVEVLSGRLLQYM